MLLTCRNQLLIETLSSHEVTIQPSSGTSGYTGLNIMHPNVATMNYVNFYMWQSASTENSWTPTFWHLRSGLNRTTLL
ncbi:MAG TPA: hypothetical protein VJQ54_04225 [Candidatus Sulfotelmatobacter sp.]|nr:hypothetical protein [Candidatus Sulfotelmatobacter sp.]